MLENPRLDRALLGSAMLLIIAGSHLGMLWLSNLYAQVGRVDSTITPELIAGLLSIVFYFLVLFRDWQWPKFSKPLFFLACFAVTAIFSELFLRGNPENSFANSSNIFISILINATIGSELGRRFTAKGQLFPFLKIFLALYVIWYAVMVYFYNLGILGFYGILPNTSFARLEFLGGFSATEIPVYVGFHLPFLIYAFFEMKSISSKIFVSLLIVCSLLLAASSISTAVFAAILMVAFIFYSTLYGINLKKVFLPTVLIVTALAVISITSSEVAESAIGKVENIEHGEGVRGKAYSYLLDLITTEPFGIGRGQFQYKNNFSWLNEGIYPHHNFLGIGAELGWIPLAFYGLFVITSIIMLARASFNQKTNNAPLKVRLLIAASLSVLIYQQFRGLFQDTWMFKEMYVWVGLGLGNAMQYSASKSKIIKNNHLPPESNL
jgi:hypothetical protein